MAAIGQPATVARSRRPFGVRLYLTLGFAAVASIAAGFSYLLVTGSSDQAAGEQAANITLGRTARLADRIGAHPLASAAAQIEPGQGSGLLGLGVRRAPPPAHAAALARRGAR